MPIRDMLSTLRGLLVISREEGANLGVVSRIYLDTQDRRILGLALSSRFGRKSTRFVPSKDIVAIGRDVVSVSAESAVQKSESGQKPPGRSLKDLQGMWVTTEGGTRLGHLVDIDFSTDDWSISELRLTENKTLRVDPNAINIGQDEIIVPKDYSDRLTTSASKAPGFLARFFGSESVEEAQQTIQRSVKGSEKGKKKGDPDNQS